MSAKYSVGRWEADRLDGHHVVILEDDRVAAFCGVVGASDDAESSANAQLISAAPNMAHALRDLIIRDYPSTYIANQSARIKAGEQPQHAVGYAIAALLKAGVL